jgi:hypothetical protein
MQMPEIFDDARTITDDTAHINDRCGLVYAKVLGQVQVGFADGQYLTYGQCQRKLRRSSFAALIGEIRMQNSVLYRNNLQEHHKTEQPTEQKPIRTI